MALQLFSEMYYIVHQKNLRSILTHGIMCHAEVARMQLTRQDISLPSAQARRARREPVFQRPIHAYVPLYFNPRNPMLYCRRALQRELVILAISREVLHTPGDRVLFTDGNAASPQTLFSQDPHIVRQAEAALRAPSWHTLHQGSRQRCAEALIHGRISPLSINRIACNNDRLAAYLHDNCPLPVEVDQALFF